MRYPNRLPPSMLSRNSLARVRAANRLYRFMTDVILKLQSHTVWTIENPLRSWLWNTIYFQRIQTSLTADFFQFDMCMFGGRRLKRTAIATNCNHVGTYALECDNHHQHAPYQHRNGVFDTSLEAEYPLPFCKVLTQAVVQHLKLHNGWDDLDVHKRLKMSDAAAAAAGRQSKRAPQTVPEFAHVISIKYLPVDVALPLDSKNMLTRCVQFSMSGTSLRVHCATKLLRRTTKGGNVSAGDTFFNGDSRDNTSAGAQCSRCSERVVQLQLCRPSDSNKWDEVVFGRHREPEQFLHEVAKAGHPQHLFSLG